MEDINDEILVVEKEVIRVQENLDNLLKIKAESLSENEELNRSISKTKHKLKDLTEHLDNLYNAAVELARAAACDFFPNEEPEYYLY